MSLLIKVFVVLSFYEPILLGRNYRYSPLFFNDVNDILSIIGLVCNNVFCRQTFNQLLSWNAVMHMTSSKLEA